MLDEEGSPTHETQKPPSPPRQARPEFPSFSTIWNNRIGYMWRAERNRDASEVMDAIVYALLNRPFQEMETSCKLIGRLCQSSKQLYRSCDDTFYTQLLSLLGYTPEKRAQVNDRRESPTGNDAPLPRIPDAKQFYMTWCQAHTEAEMEIDGDRSGTQVVKIWYGPDNRLAVTRRVIDYDNGRTEYYEGSHTRALQRNSRQWRQGLRLAKVRRIGDANEYTYDEEGKLVHVEQPITEESRDARNARLARLVGLYGSRSSDSGA